MEIMRSQQSERDDWAAAVETLLIKLIIPMAFENRSGESRAFQNGPQTQHLNIRALRSVAGDGETIAQERPRKEVNSKQTSTFKCVNTHTP
ncbi:hypothetical protein E2C01_000981 [Portunus trituberculatus]|uniref:Uncharacterized protein n=1 Tax=Portunus trituberculatus TaxID=210409 RepID=A0A5B7CI13_PORTR|nr:hypothetical protein [Portunus trituberculatus]